MRDSILFRLRPRHLGRYRKIAEILARHGFGVLLTQLGLDARLSIPRRIFRRDDEAWERVPPAVRLRLAIEELGPTFIKLGQIASTRPEIMPPAVLAELSNLQDNVPPAPWEEILPLIQQELGRPLQEVFDYFDPTPIASASLAQVYPAMAGDIHVVVKVQRPGVEQIVDTDLDIFFDIARLVRERLMGFAAFDPVALAEEFAIALREELDYRREGRNADRFRGNFAAEEHLYVPRVYWEYTTRRLIVQERIRGIKIDDIESLDAAGYDRERIALHASRLVVKQVLEDGFFHADPHPGNLLIMPNETIGLIDFGTVGYLDERDKGNLIRLYIAVIGFDVTAIVEQLIRMGIADPSVDEDGLERELRRLLRRYKGLPLKEISATELLAEIQPIIYGYQLRVPNDYWLLIKTLVLMEGVGKKLAPDFDVFAVSEPYVRRFLIRLSLPTSWGPEALRGLGGWATFINDLPVRTGRLMGLMERGQLEIRIKDTATENQTRLLNRVANRIIQAILLGSLTIGLALLLPTLDLAWPWGVLTWAAILGFGVVVVLALWLLWSIWRSGRGL